MATAPQPLPLFVAPNGMRRMAPFGNITPPGQPGQPADVRGVDNQIIKGQEAQQRFQNELKPPPPSNLPSRSAVRSVPVPAPSTEPTPVATLPTVVVTATRPVSLKYPVENDMAYHMTFCFGPYNKKYVFQDAIVEHTDFITLPLPANLAEAFGVSYNKSNLGPFGGPLASALSEGYDQMRGGRNAGSVIIDKLGEGVRRVMSDPTFVPIAIDAALRSSEQLRTAFSAATGLAPNPNPAVALQGVPLRGYTFSWRLAPESEKESLRAVDIVNSFKYLMLPKQEGFALEYAHLCDIDLYPVSLKNLIKYKTSFLTDVRVNYAPSGVPSFFAGTQLPTEIELALTFQEIKMFNQSDYDQGYKTASSRSGSPGAGSSR